MTRFFETDPHPLNVVRVRSWPEVEAITCCDHIVQQLDGAVAELLLLAFTRRPSTRTPPGTQLVAGSAH